MAKGYRLPVIGVLLFCSISTFGWTYDSQTSSTEQVMQFRVGADFTKKWKNGLRLSLTEDVRIDAYNSLNGAAFSKAYTTLTLGYTPIDYFKVDAGYTLRVMGRKESSCVHECCRCVSFAVRQTESA